MKVGDEDLDLGAMIGFIAFFIFLFVILYFLLPPVSAETQYYQIAPQNDPLTPQVHQGDTLYLGKTYDLSLVTGVSSEYAYWKNWKAENTDCNPTKTMSVQYYHALVNKSSVMLKDDQWNIGEWYYWDEYECNLTYYDYETRQTVTRNKPFDHDNKLVFFIINPPRNKPLIDYPIASIVPIKGYQTAY